MANPHSFRPSLIGALIPPFLQVFVLENLGPRIVSALFNFMETVPQSMRDNIVWLVTVGTDLWLYNEFEQQLKLQGNKPLMPHVYLVVPYVQPSLAQRFLVPLLKSQTNAYS